jgi:hypothetical protein
MCVAGRCQPTDAGTPAIAEQSDAGWLVRRIVLAPVDVAWVRAGDPPAIGAVPAVFTLGRRDGDAILLSRFSAALPQDAKIIEAYLLLRRSRALDSDPAPVSVHAARIVSPWSSASVSWASQPSTEDVRSPTTRIDPAGPLIVRLDVRRIVERWRLHDRRDQGIAVITENTTPTGISFTFTPTSTVGGSSAGAIVAPPSPSGALGILDRGTAAVSVEDGDDASWGSPRLELYVK